MKSNPNENLQALLVGNPLDGFIRHAAGMLEEYEITFLVCSDIYSAMTHLARKNGESLLVIGRLEHLGAEQGRFFQKADQKGVFCCSFVEGDLSRKRKHILNASEMGSLLTNDADRIEGVIAKFLAGTLKSSLKNRLRNSLPSPYSEFELTEEERDALLGDLIT